jgi:hypothetical protein
MPLTCSAVTPASAEAGSEAFVSASEGGGVIFGELPE